MNGDTIGTETEPHVGNGWLSSIPLSLITERVGTPTFLYSESQLLRNIARIKDAAKSAGLDRRVELYIPFFPNSNPHLLRSVQRLDGIGVLLQLPSEYALLRRYGFDKFIVSPGHISNDEIDFWCRTGCPTFLSSLDEVDHALRTSGRPVSVRIDSLASEKPGIKFSQLGQLSNALKDCGRALESFEVYCGSGKTLADMTMILGQVLETFVAHFPNARSINFAGGHGFSYEAWDESEKHFQWGEYFRSLRAISDRLAIPQHVKFLFEPARDVLADSGALLLRVKRDPIKGPSANVIATDGSRMLMPSAQLRARRHHVVFLNHALSEMSAANGIHAALRGRSVLRNDYILPGQYWVPHGVDAGCFVVILDVGAYCATQHMEFLNIPPAAEVLVDAAGVPNLITARGSELDRWRYVLEEKQSLLAVESISNAERRHEEAIAMA